MKKQRKFIIFISIVIMLFIWIPSTMKKRILLIPLSVRFRARDTYNSYKYRNLRVVDKNGETYVYIDIPWSFDEEVCKRVVSMVEEYMKAHSNLFLNQAKICISLGTSGKEIYFYNYDGEKKYDYFAKMFGTDFDPVYAKTFPDTKVLSCRFYHGDDIDEWITYLNYLNDPEKIYLYCSSDRDYPQIEQALSEMFPKCSIWKQEVLWRISEETDDPLREDSKLVYNLMKLIITISLIIVNIVLLPATTKKRILVLPLKFYLWSRCYNLYFCSCNLQVNEIDGAIHVNVDIPLICDVMKCKKMIFLVEKYMKKHMKSFLNNAKVSITIGKRPYNVSFYNYDNEKIYNDFCNMYVGENDKALLEEYAKAFPKCQILNE